MVNIELSLKVGYQIKAVPKGCWWNARRAQKRVSAMRDCFYVEGWVFDSYLRMIFDHGWLEKPDGTIIDPTLACSVLSVSDITQKSYIYFAGNRFAPSDTPNARDLPTHKEGTFSQAFLNARDAAWVSIYGRSFTEIVASLGPPPILRYCAECGECSIDVAGSECECGAWYCMAHFDSHFCRLN